MRIYAAAGALVGWFALALQLYLVLVQSRPGLAMLGAVITYFSFFTILTNLLVALVFSAIAMRRPAGRVQFLSSSSVQAATTVYIAIVGVVYQLLLRQLWNPQGAPGLPTSFCTPSFRQVTSYIGCSSLHAPACAGRMLYSGWLIRASTWFTSWCGER